MSIKSLRCYCLPLVTESIITNAGCNPFTFYLCISKTVLSMKRYSNKHVCGAPWSVANRLNGQQTGAFKWHPMPRPFQEDQPIPARPYSGVIGCHRCNTSNSGNAPASPDMLPTPLALSCMHTTSMHTIHNLHPCPHPTHHSHV